MARPARRGPLSGRCGPVPRASERLQSQHERCDKAPHPDDERRSRSMPSFGHAGMARLIRRSCACGIDVMDNRRARCMIVAMIGLRPVISRLVTLMIVLAVFVGSVGLGAMGHAAPQADAAHAGHHMHDMSGMEHGPPESTGGMQSTEADCAMAVCCFSTVTEPRADHARVAVGARFAPVAATPASQPAPDRADKPPKRT